MKKLLLALAIVALAATPMTAQVAKQSSGQVKKECCKDIKDGKKCDKPADQQCPDCKAKAAKQCDKANAPKQCKDGNAKPCDKANAPKQCKDGNAKPCDKANTPKQCKNGNAKPCDKANAPKQCKEGMKECKQGEGMKKDCCKDKKDGHACNKPADQQCPDCKAKAKKD